MPAKQYSNSVNYEKKLQGIMERFGVDEYNYDWTRQDCFIEFRLKGQYYRFEHSIKKAKDTGQNIQWVSDLFAQLVLTLEDIARMSERGIYELSSWIEGMKALPPAKQMPECFKVMGFADVPTKDELSKRYKQLAKVTHPDTGGNADDFMMYKDNYEKCIKQMEDKTDG
ncbi:MAG: J domain-containing protein [Angelakisella sp.]